MSSEESLESLSSRMAGSEESQVLDRIKSRMKPFIPAHDNPQVSLHFIKPDSDVSYSVILTRTPPVFHQEIEPPSSTDNSEIVDSLRPPFPAVPRSLISSGTTAAYSPFLPLKNGLSNPLEPEATRDAILTPSLTSDSFEKSSSNFARTRAEREASMDFSAAFRLKDKSATETSIQASKAKFSFKNMFFPSSI
jgi:hypothetical protein